MIGKSVYLLFLLVATAAIANAAPAESNELIRIERPSSGPHNLIIGSRTPSDKLIISTTAIAAVAENQTRSSSDPSGYVLITSTLRAANEETKITQVRALDQTPNGNGAFATLLSGGPGANDVTLQFKSQGEHGINFVIEMYGE